MWLPAVWMHYETFNFLPSLVWFALLFSLLPFVSPSLPRYFVFSITWMSLFSTERAERVSSERRCALFTAMLFLLLFRCSNTQMDSPLLLELSVCLSACLRLCQFVCLSLSLQSTHVRWDISGDSRWEFSKSLFVLWSDLISRRPYQECFPTPADALRASGNLKRCDSMTVK